jgi:hypothetical protein
MAPAPVPMALPEPPTAPEPPPAQGKWYDAITFSAFADAYVGINYNFPKPQTDKGLVNKNKFRAYDVNNGFSLSWVGLNAGIDPDPVGGAIQLRFGQTAEIYNACVSASTACDNQVGLQFVKQAYASWRPGGADGMLTLDFGKFDTLYGAEVADSQFNQNYTRGVLYWLAQPLFHTGLRAAVQASDAIALKAMLVNGWNRSIDNNVGKSIGLQLAATPSDQLALYVGWLGGPEQDDTTVVTCAVGEAYDPAAGGCAASAGSPGGDFDVDRGGANDLDAWRHLVDLVVTLAANDAFSLVFNADYGVDGVRDPISGDTTSNSYYGFMLGGRYALDDVWALALRGEYLGDPDGYATATGNTDVSLATGTLTIEAKPTQNLILRLDTRGDFALGGEPSEELFDKELRETSSSQITTTLGVVVTTN